MNERRHLPLTLLAAFGFGLALFQCWYVYLPLEAASAFDLCRISRTIDCFLSLNTHGSSLKLGFVPVFPLLLALFFLQAALAAFAWAADNDARQAMVALARLLAFPLAGLAIFVLLNDFLVAKATSVSAILVTAITVAQCVLTFLRGVRSPLRPGLATAGALTAIAALLGFFAHGAGSARLGVDLLTRERASAPPQVRIPRFAFQMPRRHAAWVGRQTAETEILLFVDPTNEASRRLMHEAATLDADAYIVLYAPGEPGAHLVLAHKEDRLAAYLTDPQAPTPADPARAQAIVERQEQTRKELGIETFPTALWNGGKKSGEFTLAEVLREAGVATTPPAD